MKTVGPTWIDRVVMLLLVVAATWTLQVGSKTQGYTRDEGYYFQAAELHVAYLEESLAGLRKGRLRTFADRAVIDRYLGYNSEHPPLMKTLFGVSWRLLHRCDCPKEAGLHALPYSQRHKTLGLLSQGQAMRLPTHLLLGLLCAAVYAVGRRLFGRRAGLVAAALTLLSPRLFFHGQLSCFDAPVTAMIFLTTAAYLRAEETRCTWWALIAGVVFGLSILTKLNAFFLPPVLLAHSLYTRRAELAGEIRHRLGIAQVTLSRLTAAAGSPDVRGIGQRSTDGGSARGSAFRQTTDTLAPWPQATSAVRSASLCWGRLSVLAKQPPVSTKPPGLSMESPRAVSGFFDSGTPRQHLSDVIGGARPRLGLVRVALPEDRGATRTSCPYIASRAGVFDRGLKAASAPLVASPMARMASGPSGPRDKNIWLAHQAKKAIVAHAGITTCAGIADWVLALSAPVED